jgi:hypothetical protein
MPEVTDVYKQAEMAYQTSLAQMQDEAIMEHAKLGYIPVFMLHDVIIFEY